MKGEGGRGEGRECSADRCCGGETDRLPWIDGRDGGAAIASHGDVAVFAELRTAPLGLDTDSLLETGAKAKPADEPWPA